MIIREFKAAERDTELRKARGEELAPPLAEVDGKRLDAKGVNEHGVLMCQCKRFGPVHAWEPGEWCGDHVIPKT